MKVEQLVIRISKMKDRDALRQIIGAAEARDSKLLNIESDKERSRLWDKISKLGIKKGDMVFIHTPLKSVTNRRGESSTVGTGQHHTLWAKPLTVHAVRPRAKEISVLVPGSTKPHVLTAFTCEKLKLSLEPSAAALAAGLQERVVSEPRPGTPEAIRWAILKKASKQRRMPKNKGDTITIRRPVPFTRRTA